MTWMRGSAIVSAKSQRDRMPLTDFLASLARRPRHQVPGTAVYLSAEPTLTPSALLHNLKHNGVLHKINAIVAVETTDEPRVPPDTRARVSRLNDTFMAITLAFGFMETPDVPAALARLNIPGVTFDPADTSYFLGRRTILPTHDRGLRRLQDLLFISLSRNSADPERGFRHTAGAGGRNGRSGRGLAPRLHVALAAGPLHAPELGEARSRDQSELRRRPEWTGLVRDISVEHQHIVETASPARDV